MLEVNFERARAQMVSQQIRGWGVLDPDVIAVMGRLARERFVPERYRNLAYADSQIPIGQGEVMLQPSVQGRLLQAVEIAHGERALEVGTGTGYLAACLAELGAKVYSVEYHAELAKTAGETLAAYGISGVTVAQEDAHTMEESGTRYDVILVTGSLPETDRSFMHRLSVGGRLGWILGQAPAMHAELVTRVDTEEWRRESLFETVVPPLIGAVAKEAFEF